MIHFTKNRAYWLEHPEHGTIKAKLEIVSTNGLSLGFMLKEYVGLKHRNPIVGLAFAKFLPVRNNHDDTVSDIISGSRWKVYTSEPAEPPPPHPVKD